MRGDVDGFREDGLVEVYVGGMSDTLANRCFAQVRCG